MSSFGAMLRQLREDRTVVVARTNQWGTRWTQAPLSQNELGRRAGVDAALVNRLESGAHRGLPRRETALRLADALELDAIARARLLIAAGYWPWTDLDDGHELRVIATALAVVDGDYRILEGDRIAAKVKER